METKICTSIEQSLKFIELGIDTNTADMCYKCIGEDPYDLVVKPYSEWKEEYRGLLIRGDANILPAWSFSSLFGLAPKYLNDAISDVKLDLQPIGDKWSCAYVRCTNRYSTICNFYCSNPIDAVFNMIVWLKENKKI
jgi:hypothetical protein